MDNLESDIVFSSICKTDTVYPYGCNEYHSQIARNYDLSVSPNIQGFRDYQATHTYTTWVMVSVDEYAFDQVGYNNFANDQFNKIQGQIASSLAQIKSQREQIEKWLKTPYMGWIRPNNSVCSNAAGDGNPVCVSKISEPSLSWLEDVNLVAAVYQQRLVNSINWLDACYVANSSKITTIQPNINECGMFAAGVITPGLTRGGTATSLESAAIRNTADDAALNTGTWRIVEPSCQPIACTNIPGLGSVPKSNTINVTNSGWQHLYDRHIDTTIFINKSKFANNVDVLQLIKNAETITPIKQSNGYSIRIVNNADIIGIDRNTSQSTSIYTVVTNSNNDLITAFPGNP